METMIALGSSTEAFTIFFKRAGSLPVALSYLVSRISGKVSLGTIHLRMASKMNIKLKIRVKGLQSSEVVE
jgi:hypothetical protein